MHTLVDSVFIQVSGKVQRFKSQRHPVRAFAVFEPKPVASIL